MNKVEVYEVKAPCLDTSFDVASDNGTPIASPKDTNPGGCSSMMQSQTLNAENRMENDNLRCDETIREECPMQ